MELYNNIIIVVIIIIIIIIVVIIIVVIIIIVVVIIIIIIIVVVIIIIIIIIVVVIIIIIFITMGLDNKQTCKLQQRVRQHLFNNILHLYSVNLYIKSMQETLISPFSGFRISVKKSAGFGI